MHPIVIIGSGMAGYTVAREFRKLSPEQELVMICADDAVNYAKPTLSNAFAGNKAPEQIALGDANKMATQLNMRIEAETWVKEINAANHEITLEKNGETVTQPYSKLVLAVGANPIRLAIAGDGSDDIHVVNSLIDYRTFRENLAKRKDKRVVILGAGLIGCEFANDLLHSNYDVTVIDLAAQPLGRLLPNHVAEAFKTNLEQAGIKFALSTTVEKVSKINDGEDYAVTLANGQTLVADIVLSAIGLQPNITLAKAADIQTSRGIITNTLLETNQADIYAVGDCAEVNGTLLPFVMPIMQQARALAKTLSGQSTSVHYPAMPVAVKTPAAPLTVLPAPLDVDVNWETEEFDDGMLAKAADGEGTLRGFVLLGATAAKQRLTLTKLVPDLIPAQV
ncbi:rubredoxin-NAD(+) reductase [Acinetobacter proteolyticus]|jgi:rubredoxin-NAD+ reductase|uniref:FAD-dependent oxidoreductase n=1 Tax=Acinetobacter proteolyticus TaxID=1776741 RepID=A0A653KAS0_9GAMM|nr:rubredoxin reductase RubB [Acinetobacter proteolyticus]QHH94643.1 FAD-dependent oxidoreductase [Acinetobacter gyllenbergii]ENU24410.1 rubredoxin-NAD(+) reductase [Acinetobacter proteolyticus]OEY95958.1 pyridine nucleotide-disulfide oxidoreductase [Acinetobacter proteolyticus]PKF31899.1 FAD-dependent oxidoreductase [Acinetobacter proteolyticus]VXA57162.1 rubredoxin-NAD(+) reductase [Acinetobacter proteolyticus]